MNDTKILSALRGTAGGGASPDSEVLYLTNIRSTQQDKEKIAAAIKEAKRKMRGKPFIMRIAPSIYCKRNPIAIIAYRSGKVYKITLAKINCNSWTCPNCSKIKAIKARYLVRETAVLNNLFYFLTLTLDPKKIPFEFLSKEHNNTHKYITSRFNIFWTDLRRKVNTPTSEVLKYLWVIEFQKKGNAHLHILLNKYISKDLIDQIWIRVGGGKITWVTKAQSIEALSFYLSSYIAKGLKQDPSEKSYFKFFEKRYSISQSCTRPTKTSLSLLFKNLSEEEKMILIKDLGLEWVYTALTEKEFEEKLILFENKEKPKP